MKDSIFKPRSVRFPPDVVAAIDDLRNSDGRNFSTALFTLVRLGNKHLEREKAILAAADAKALASAGEPE